MHSNMYVEFVNKLKLHSETRSMILKLCMKLCMKLRMNSYV